MASYTQYWKLDGSGPFNVNREAGQSIIEPVRNKYYLTNSNSTSSSNPGTEVLVTDPNAVSSASSASTRPPNAVSSAAVPAGPPNAVSSAAVPAGPPNAVSSATVPAGPPNAVSSAAVPAGPPTTLRLSFQLPNKDKHRDIITTEKTLNAVVADRKDIFGEFSYRFTFEGRVLDNTTTFDANGIVAKSIIIGTYTLDSIINIHLSKNTLARPITTLFYFDAEFQAFNMADSAPFAHTPPSNGTVKATHFILNMGHICLELEQNRVSQSMSIAPLFVNEGAQFRDPTILLAKYIIANDVAWPEIERALKIDLPPIVDPPDSFSVLPIQLKNEHVVDPHTHKLNMTTPQTPLLSIELHKLFRRTPTVNSCLAGVASSTDAVISLVNAETDNTYPFLNELLSLYPDKVDQFRGVLARTYELYMEHSFNAVNIALSGNTLVADVYFRGQLNALYERMQDPHTLFVCKGKTDLYAIYNTFRYYGLRVMDGQLQCAFFDLDIPRAFPIMKLSIVSDLYKSRYGLTDFYNHMQGMYITDYLRGIGSTRIVEHNPLVDSLMHMMAHIGFSFDVNGTVVNSVIRRTNFSIFDIIQTLFQIPYYQPHDNSHKLTIAELHAISYPTKIDNTGAIVLQREAFVNGSMANSFELGCLLATSYFSPPRTLNITDIYVDPSSGDEFIVSRLNDGTYRIKNITKSDDLTGIIYTYMDSPPHTYVLDTHKNSTITMTTIRSIQTTGSRIIPNSIQLKRVSYTANGRPIDITMGQQIIGRNYDGSPVYRNIYRSHNDYYYILSTTVQNTLELVYLKIGADIRFPPPPPPPGPPGHPRRRKTRQRRALKSRRRKSRKAQ
jgi:hypothetical protein